MSEYPPGYFGDDDDDEGQDHMSDESSAFEPGCLFPGRCCMPSEHFTSECHTAEDMIAQEMEARAPEIEKDVIELMAHLTNQQRGELVQRILSEHGRLCRIKNAGGKTA
jgi:hypothetical protein